MLGLILFVVAAIIYWSPRPQIKNLDDKYVLITGCDSGFGRKLSIELDLCGCNIIACCLTKRGVEDLTSICSNRLYPIIVDVTNSDDIHRAVDLVGKHLPMGKGLWGMVNNAGIASTGAIEWTPLSKLRQIFNVNVFGMVEMTKAMLPLIKIDQGRIVNLASMLGRFSVPYSASYSMSKFAVEAFSDSLRREMKLFNVSVHIIEPGFFKTHILDNLEDEFLQLYHNCNSTIRQDYGDHFAKEGVKKITEFNRSRASNNIAKVTKAIKNALFSPKPRERYLVGLEANILSLMAYLPSFISDHILYISGQFPAPCRAI
ncbi:uncharacterized protein TRIADDRAFT_35982 [Trichoplax adhaerens]|uniref:Retinol dehydrogenase 7 n=1 Tax=Trichoplax adhaerens TaxID=10228 RepID=B3RXQ2_TRIAD|nr:hypothetical protein TRIADDRAFT_35982 [Trichoplax adhaerens]EDV24897.1 hypothetical protein TRIADDRAFT_35982 [Trichoplax adhaerens]|eukprot:XP_002112787.1 hypothetical protein TRIADDRAFT_35982 [Trichoplax adhaerens]